MWTESSVNSAQRRKNPRERERERRKTEWERNKREKSSRWQDAIIIRKTGENSSPCWSLNCNHSPLPHTSFWRVCWAKSNLLPYDIWFTAVRHSACLLSLLLSFSIALGSEISAGSLRFRENQIGESTFSSNSSIIKKEKTTRTNRWTSEGNLFVNKRTTRRDNCNSSLAVSPRLLKRLLFSMNVRQLRDRDDWDWIPMDRVELVSEAEERARSPHWRERHWWWWTTTIPSDSSMGKYLFGGVRIFPTDCQCQNTEVLTVHDNWMHHHGVEIVVCARSE